MRNWVFSLRNLLRGHSKVIRFERLGAERSLQIHALTIKEIKLQNPEERLSQQTFLLSFQIPG